MEIIRDILQNSPEWDLLRLGSIGGSGISAIVPGGAGMKGMLYSLSSEIVTGVKSENFKFQHADRGHEYEPVARAAYVFEHNADVELITMVKDGPYKHYSPDIFVSEDGLGEIKVRIPKVYIENRETLKMPIGDKRQIQWGLGKCEKEWCDYIQYCPEMKTDPLFVQRIVRDEKMIKEMNEYADRFIEKMLTIVEKYKK